MCPSGSYAPSAGMSSCLACNGSTSRSACPVGSHLPAPIMSYAEEAWKTGVGGLSDLQSEDHPDVNLQTGRTKNLVQTIQLFITGVGFSLFFLFLTVLSITALSHPQASADRPLKGMETAPALSPCPVAYLLVDSKLQPLAPC